MSSYICFQARVIIFATILSRCGPGDCQQQLSVDLGPRNITRYEHEANIYIPCPFSGSSNPIWRINGIDYEAFNLPLNMLPVSYGLLIPAVDLGMDGKSFQCIVQREQSQELRSTIGILKVAKVSQEYTVWYRENNAAIQTSFSSTFSLNHQNTLFDANTKHFSWNMDSSCNIYRIYSTNCDNITQQIWNFIQGTSLSIPSSYLVDSSSGESLFFTLESIAIEGRSVRVCNTLRLDFAVKQADITEKRSVPYSGTCVDVDSETGGLNIVLPRKIINEDDCPCSIITSNQTPNNLTTCSCAHETIFADAISVSKSNRTTNAYSICFHNLTNEMNNTIIHFYDLYRWCIDSNGVQQTRPFRMYLKSMRIVIELPYHPVIMVNADTGEVIISSDTAEGIELDYYKITLSDVTKLVVYHRTVSRGVNSTSFGNIFKELACSPYNVTVTAYTVLGKSISNSTMIVSGNNTNECTCIAEYVDVELDLIIDDESQQPEIGVQLQVNCTQHRYEDSISVQIEILQDDINITKPITATCKKTVMYYNLERFIECDKAYDLIPYWISQTNKWCDLYSKSFNKKISCPEKSSTNHKVYITIIVIAAILGGLVFFCGLVIMILGRKYYILKKQNR